MTITDKYAEKTRRLENAVAEEVRGALQPLWKEVYRNAQDGDLVGKLRQALEGMDTDLRNLALALLPSKAGQEQQALTRFLEAEDPLADFYQLGNSLAANKSPEPILDQLTGWMLAWGVQYLDKKDATKWSEDDEKKMWRMVRWARPCREADQNAWQAFGNVFGPRSWRRAARKHMEDSASRPTPGVLANILNELPADADELFHVNNEGVPNLKAVAEIRDPRTLADDQLVKYSPSVWREVINDGVDARQDRPASSVLKWAGGIAFVIVLTALVWFGLNQLDPPEVAETPIASETPLSEETEEPGAAGTPLPDETQAVALTLVGAAWGCAAGNESWHKVTVTGEPNATYSIQTDSGSLPEGVIIWKVADAQPPDPNRRCHPPETPLNNNSGTLDANGNAHLLISQFTSGTSPLSLQVVSKNTPSDPIELSPWAGDVQAQLSSVSEIPTADAPLVFTEPISFTWEIAVTVPGEYQLVCINKAMPDNLPVVSATLVFDAPNVSQPAECLIESAGDWEVSVFRTPYEENDPVDLSSEVNSFSVVTAHYELAIQSLSDDPVGIRWAPQVDITQGDIITRTIEYKLGFIPTYAISNTGNITNEVQVNLVTEDSSNLDLNNDWVYFVTVLGASDVLTGTLSSPIPDDIQNGYVITVTHADGLSYPLTAIVPSESNIIQFSLAPDEALYIAVWLDTRTLSNVSETNPVRATIDFVSSPDFSTVTTIPIEIISFTGGEIKLP